MKNKEFTGKVGFAVGTGRCGTMFMAGVLSLEKRVASVHERNVLNETFHRYCKWYDLPVDHEGFLYVKENEIQDDLRNVEFSFEASAQLALSIVELYERFDAKFILMVRSPERVVNSHLTKTWYENPFVQRDKSLALGYQDHPSIHHFLGRIAPRGEHFEHWNRMTRIGKLSWFWNALNERVLQQFSMLPESHWRIEKLEELSFDKYLDIASFFGYESTLTKEAYNALVRKRPNAARNVPTISTWTFREVEEFEKAVEPMAKELGYEFRVHRLPILELQGSKSVDRGEKADHDGNEIFHEKKYKWIINPLFHRLLELKCLIRSTFK
ncbi:MAG: hypothetical protein JRJ85_19665 [Deltaproteobacteria bacterium]|nr:hypothetical protein [Deltaproteobacteria bacterium]